jgi:hypothetical protein
MGSRLRASDGYNSTVTAVSITKVFGNGGGVALDMTAAETIKLLIGFDLPPRRRTSTTPLRQLKGFVAGPYQ